MKNRSLVTLAGHSREKIEYLIKMAQEFERHPNRRLLAGKVVATLFFEPSTRTRLSFETAANRLGARVIGFADPKVTSGTKGETLKDTIMMVSSYADVIVMRHYLEGAALYASEVAPVPIMNAGDGANQHPSQTMLDLYTIYQTQGTLDNLNIYMVGDLKYGRTVHSLLMAMRHFNPTFHFIAPDELAMPTVYKRYCEEFGISKEAMYKLGEGFGTGIGGLRDTCSAVMGMFFILSLANSAGNMEKPLETKLNTYEKFREAAAKFQEENGSIYCRDLKFPTDRKPVSCFKCVEDAAALVDEYLAKLGY